MIGLSMFSMVLSNLSIFLCGGIVFGIPLAALQSFFFFAHAYTSAPRSALIM